MSRNLKKNYLIKELSFKIKEAVKQGKKTVIVNNSNSKLDICNFGCRYNGQVNENKKI